MRYTEYEFTVDHIFDLIRIAFSSVFLAPLRIVSEVSKKVMYIEKSKITKCCKVSLALGVLLLLADLCIAMAHKSIYLYEGSTPVVAEIIAIFILGCLYYASTIYDQPSVVYNSKPRQQNRKRPKVQVDPILDEEDLIEDSLDDFINIEEDTSEEPVNNNNIEINKAVQLKVPNLTKPDKEDDVNSAPSRISLAGSGLNLNINIPNIDELPGDDVPITGACNSAEKEDIFNIVKSAVEDLSAPPVVPSISKDSTFDGEQINQFAQFADISRNLDPNKNIIDF